MGAEPELLLEALSGELVGRRGPEHHGRGRASVERADIDERITLSGDVLLQGADRGIEIGGERHRHGDLGEGLTAPDRGVDDRVGRELLVRDNDSPAVE